MNLVGKPKSLNTEQWEEIQAFVETTCQALYDDPANRGRRDPGYYNLVARYCGWLRFEQGHELDRMLFSREMVSYYVATALGHMTDKSRASYRSQLFAASQSLLPASMSPTPTEDINQRKASEPYDERDVARMVSWANGQPTEHLRRNANVILVCGLGAGFKMRETNALLGRHVHSDEYGIVLTSPADGRKVPLSAKWEDVFRTTLTDLDGEDDFVFRPGRIHSQRGLTNAGSDFLGTTKMRQDAPDAYRLRATWIVRHLVARVPFDVLVRAAGLKEAVSLARYLQLVPEAEFEGVRELLRYANNDRERRRRRALRLVETQDPA